MLSKQAGCLSYFVDYQLIVFFDASLTKRSIVLYNSFFSFFGVHLTDGVTLLPLLGVDSFYIYTQGVALGYALMPLQGVK